MIENVLMWVCIMIIVGLLCAGMFKYYKDSND